MTDTNGNDRYWTFAAVQHQLLAVTLHNLYYVISPPKQKQWVSHFGHWLVTLLRCSVALGA